MKVYTRIVRSWLFVWIMLFLMVVSGVVWVSVSAETLSPNGIQAIPLNDLTSNYLGFSGGLYPDGNTMPTAHDGAGKQYAEAIRPLNKSGKPANNGHIVFLSIGMSNSALEFCSKDLDGVSCNNNSFMAKAAADPEIVHHNLVLINGAMTGQSTDLWSSSTANNYDRIRDDILADNNLSEAQVQVVWVKLANKFSHTRPSLPDANADAYVLARELGNTIRALKTRYPNLQQVFLTSRIYGGYAKATSHSPEPYAYETGFAVKWLIEAQINQMASGQIDPIFGDLNYNDGAAWLSWSLYPWANGTQSRSDGLTWELTDFNADGIHPSPRGVDKFSDMLLDYFKQSFHTCWFVVECSGPPPPPVLDKKLLLPILFN